MKPLTLLICFLVVMGLVDAQRSFPDNGKCQTPDNRPGHCIVIRSCPSLIRIFSQKPVSVENKQFLRNSSCGFEGNNAKVCCPVETSRVIESTTSKNFIYSDYNNNDEPLIPRFPNCGITLYNEKIINGKNAKVGEFPWAAVLGYFDSQGTLNWLCGGSLISNRYVLTAAHCIYTKQGWRLKVVRLGEHTISNRGQDCHRNSYCAPLPQDFEIEATSVHPQFGRRGRFSNDIGLIRLRNPATLSNFVRPICLPFNELASKNLEQLNRFQEKICAAGWGRTNYSIPENSDVLQKVMLSIVPIRKCQKYYRNRGVQLNADQLCAGGEMGKDTCQGDSGGALMHLQAVGVATRFSAVGVASGGSIFCGNGWPGIYTRVGAYLSWIQQNVTP